MYYLQEDRGMVVGCLDRPFWPQREFLWKISNFSTLPQEPDMYLESPVFSSIGSSWRVRLFPNGERRHSSRGWFGLYISQCDGHGVSSAFDACLRSVNGVLDFYATARSSSRGSETWDTYGFSRYLWRGDFLIRSYRYLPGDTLTIWICLAHEIDESLMRVPLNSRHISNKVTQTDSSQLEVVRVKSEHISVKSEHITSKTTQTESSELQGSGSPLKSRQRRKKRLEALRAYNMYKEELSLPHVNKRKVWEKMAKTVRTKCLLSEGSYGLQHFHSQMLSLKYKYRRMRNEEPNVKDPYAVTFLCEAQLAFEDDPEFPGSGSSQKSRQKRKNRLEALKAYNVYKEELFLTDMNKIQVWGKMAQKVRTKCSLSKRYSIRHFHSQILSLKHEYERKRNCRSSDEEMFLKEAQLAFEDGRQFPEYSKQQADENDGSDRDADNDDDEEDDSESGKCAEEDDSEDEESAKRDQMYKQNKQSLKINPWNTSQTLAHLRSSAPATNNKTQLAETSTRKSKEKDEILDAYFKKEVDENHDGSDEDDSEGEESAEDDNESRESAEEDDSDSEESTEEDDNEDEESANEDEKYQQNKQRLKLNPWNTSQTVSQIQKSEVPILSMKEKTPAINDKTQLAETSSRKSKEKDEISDDLTKLSDNLRELYLEEEYCDVTIAVNDKIIQAHKMILNARSRKLLSLLKNNSAENKNPVIQIKDCDPEAFEVFLLYLYTGKVEKLSSTNMFDVYHLAVQFDEPDLKAECVAQIKRSMTVQNICSVTHVAREHNDPELLKCVTDYTSLKMCTKK